MALWNLDGSQVRTSHDDADRRLLPVADEALRPGLEEGHRRVLLRASLVDQVVVDLKQADGQA